MIEQKEPEIKFRVIKNLKCDLNSWSLETAKVNLTRIRHKNSSGWISCTINDLHDLRDILSKYIPEFERTDMDKGEEDE